MPPATSFEAAVPSALSAGASASISAGIALGVRSTTGKMPLNEGSMRLMRSGSGGWVAMKLKELWVWGAGLRPTGVPLERFNFARAMPLAKKR